MGLVVVVFVVAQVDRARLTVDFVDNVPRNGLESHGRRDVLVGVHASYIAQEGSLRDSARVSRVHLSEE